MPLTNDLPSHEAPAGEPDAPDQEDTVSARPRLTPQAAREVSLALARVAIAIVRSRRNTETGA